MGHGGFSTFRRSRGILELLVGYLTDQLGRQRVLTYSILFVYAVAAFLSGFSTLIGMLLVLRCFVFIWVCVEFSPRSRRSPSSSPSPSAGRKSSATRQAFSSLSGLLVAFANGLAVKYHASLPALSGFGIEGIVANRARHLGDHRDVGVIPGDSAHLHPHFPAQSPLWQQKKAAGTLGAEHRRLSRRRCARRPS